jgi:putative NIF3 family GTP cyclohydrolase 1 type 2
MPLQKIAVGCGSAGSFLEDVKRSGCNVFVTGETSFHLCLEARASKIGLILTGHYASERFAVERLAEILARQFPDLQVWASRMETDPIQAV